MPLVEITVGKDTSDETLARGFDYVLQIGQTPIVVNDSRGFYDWTPDGKQLWPELVTLYPLAAQQPEQRELIDRLMFAQANEAARCFEEGVLRSTADGNIGSIFGWGFAPFQGGALQFINAMGAAAFVARARELAAKFGARFEPAAVVVKQAQTGGRFSDN